MKLLESPPSGDELKEIRLTYRLSIRQMGKVLNVTAQTIRSYEAGKTRFPCKHLKRLNRLLSQPVPPEPPAPLSPDELYLLRTSRGLSQKQAADAFGISVTSIVNYEKGRTAIPAGLAECIKRLAEPKADTAPKEAPTHTSAHEQLHNIYRRLKEEREKWHILPRDLTPSELRQYRLSRGLTEQKLGEMLGLPQSTLQSYESGRRTIPSGLAERLADLNLDAVIAPAEIRDLRLALGLSQSDVSAALGYSPSAIQLFEAGTRKISQSLSEKMLEYFREEAYLETTSVEIRAMRERMHLTQQAFAELLGIKRSSEALYETGKRKMPREIRRKLKELAGSATE